MLLIILILLFILYIIFYPKIDRTAYGYYILWYSTFKGKRKFKILGKL